MAKQLLTVQTTSAARGKELYISKGNPRLVKMDNAFELFTCVIDVY